MIVIVSPDAVRRSGLYPGLFSFPPSRKGAIGDSHADFQLRDKIRQIAESSRKADFSRNSGIEAKASAQSRYS